ncbi:MAG: flagellar hook protein FlgE [Alphaproteobacteria bacterium]|nr:flagellar hook protein FlgE [Alphaproteobacteria bacterium]
MSLYGALYTGVAGLAANSRAMAVTSTNIANINTVGYKTTRNEFSTLIASASGTGTYATGGVKSVALPEITQQGDLSQTASSTDLAISGQGFFVVTNTAIANPTPSELLYTRAGAFQKDANGYLYNAGGYFLQGWALDANGNIPTNANEMTLVNLGQITGTALPTTTTSLRANLQSTLTPVAAYTAGDMNAGTVSPQFESSIEVYDSQGSARPVRMAFLKTAANTWQYEVIYDGNPADIGGAASNPIYTGTMTFNTDGTIATPAPPVNITIPFTAASGLSAQPIDFSFGTPGAADGFTQFDTTSTLYGSNINGTLFGGLAGVRVDEQGFIIALFTNGIEKQLYKLPVATFLNADGLGALNSNAYRATVESGGASFKSANVGGAGSISGLTLEQSTVDLAKEFSNMIVIQRAYTAASKIITTADEMLEELTRLKR